MSEREANERRSRRSFAVRAGGESGETETSQGAPFANHAWDEIRSKGSGLVEYEAVQKWDGKLPETMLGNNSMPFINLGK